MTDDPTEPEASIPEGAVRVAPRRQTPLYRFLSSRLLAGEAWLQSHGGVGLRWGIRGFWAFLTAIGILLLIGPVINKPLSFEDITSSTDDITSTWLARSFDGEYTFVRGDDGRLTMQVEERITAFFPEDLNEDRIERTISTQYEGHDLDLTLTSAQLDGATITPQVDAGPIRTTITVDAGERLTGDHTVVLRYDLHDVANVTQDLSSREVYQQLQWEAFGPDWTHATAATSATIRVPQELVDAFAQQPRGGVEWLLLAESTTLTPEPSDDGYVHYSISNDQNLPPHALFWFQFRFTDDTFTMPDPSPVFWVQLFGPFVPLALLALTVLMAFAARAVAWADARGRAWFVMQERPRRGSTPALDARLWRAWRTSPLVDAIAQYQSAPKTPASVRVLVRTARRTGRWGDIPHAAAVYRSAPSWQEQFTKSLRRIPRGFVRDGFIGASLALTVIQWGLVRQLSYQVALTELWWPAAIVLITTLLALVVLAIAFNARPLTHEGALDVEHMRGQRLFLDQTLSAERTSLRDPQLPYVVMFESPRRAGRIVRDLVNKEGLSEEAAADPKFVTGGRLAVRAAAVTAFIALAVFSFVMPASTSHRLDTFEILDDVEGDYALYANDVDIEATLSTSTEGRLQMDVVENLQVTVGESGRAIPQVTRAWQDRADGHDQQLTVEEILIDGEPVAFEQTRERGYALVQSRLPDQWPGEYDVTVRYVLASPASAIAVDGEWVDQVRWAALLPWWSTTWDGVDQETERLRVAVRVPTDLAQQFVGATGWLDEVPHRAPRPPIRFDPHNDVADSVTTADGYTIYAFDETVDREYERDSLWPSGANYSGIQLQFPSGTFAGTDRGEWEQHQAWSALPWIVAPAVAGIVVLLSIVGIAAARSRTRLPGPLRDAVRWFPPALTLAQFFLLFWATKDLYSEDPLLPVVLLALGASIVMSIWVLIATRMQKKSDGPATLIR